MFVVLMLHVRILIVVLNFSASVRLILIIYHLSTSLSVNFRLCIFSLLKNYLNINKCFLFILT